ncbi:hypothetical protein OSB04_011329 [Centaurea solstitialis]|uniref:Integrase catalytic domain-containing protein n=1 Tax=Centaurea solstitialis TaxID=347529 RepID=A0AA38WLE6_9ASTR|nr:hypothetical protein OSB04_011329 [Centaurea solstitialis]
MESGKDLLDLIHTNVCGPFRSATRNGERYFCSKGFKNEVENQLGKKIKILRSDRNCGIVSQLSLPRTPQLNGVAERRNRTLLDMVRSMMSRATLPMSFSGYALCNTRSFRLESNYESNGSFGIENGAITKKLWPKQNRTEIAQMLAIASYQPSDR